jgi:hypothetical protein
MSSNYSLDKLQTSFYQTENQCRSCGFNQLEQILDLGRTSLADRLLTAEQLDKPELIAPLNYVRCPECSLVQLM